MKNKLQNKDDSQNSGNLLLNTGCPRCIISSWVSALRWLKCLWNFLDYFLNAPVPVFCKYWILCVFQIVISCLTTFLFLFFRDNYL